jgi:hypothetical protein
LLKLTLAVLFIGLFAQAAKKYDLDFRLVFIPSSPVTTAATLNTLLASRQQAEAGKTL